jgi:hypothetical protein
MSDDEDMPAMRLCQAPHNRPLKEVRMGQGSPFRAGLAKVALGGNRAHGRPSVAHEYERKERPGCRSAPIRSYRGEYRHASRM